jgi:YidC/Oxa1 family membrane protein insertase
MEQRAFVAVVLMAAVLILYQAFLVPTPDVAPPAPRQPEQATRETAPSPAVVPGPSQAPPAAPLPMPSTPTEARPPQRISRVTTPLYEAAVSSEGGKFQEFVLSYRGEKPLVAVGDFGPTGLVVATSDRGGQVLPMEPSSGTIRVGAEQQSQELRLTGSTDGLRVEEALTFRPNTYTVDTRVRIENRGTAPRAVTVAIPWSTRQDWRDERAKERFQGQYPTEIVWSAGGVIARAENLCEVPAIMTDGAWIGTGSVWYMAALIPHGNEFKLVARGEEKACDAKSLAPVGRATIAVQATPTIGPGQTWEGRVTVFLGPKEYDRLKSLGLDGAINFGGFPIPRDWGGLPMEWLGVPILVLMNWVYRHVGNYGVAIILLTVVSKILFYPLTVKSMRSMKAMQALQPQINALRSKYKSDPQRLQRETMGLYRQHKVNPMGGCLPMVAQVPIFYALYLALSVSVELQNATFFCFGQLFGVHLWICDLASHDPTYVLPILMGVTMFIQQKLTPVAGDPRQAKIMLVMPFVFTFMFLNLPAGLVLYWTVSNILQILQQWYMDRPKAPAPREARDASRA